jgi:hypothetical protein
MLTSHLPRFRWVVCQLDHLCNLTTDRERILALKTLPPTLYSTYDRILERLNDKGESACRLVERALKWLVGPVRGPTSIRGTDIPLITARELCIAVSIDFGDTTTNLDGIPSIDEIMVHCSSFLRLFRDNDYVFFAHFTVEEYLLSIDPREKPQLARYRCDEPSMSTYIVETCLSFLNLDSWRRTHFMSGLVWRGATALLQAKALSEHCNWSRNFSAPAVFQTTTTGCRSGL